MEQFWDQWLIAQPLVGVVNPGQPIQSCMRKQRSKPWGVSQPVSSVSPCFMHQVLPPGSGFEFLPDYQGLTMNQEVQDEPTPFQTRRHLITVLITAIENK